MCAVLVIAGFCNIDPMDFIHKFPIKKILSTRKFCIVYYTIYWLGNMFQIGECAKNNIQKKKPINYYNENLIIIKKKEPIVALTK